MIIKRDADETGRFLTDASNLPGGSVEQVYVAESSEDVVRAVTECRKDEIPLTVSGAGTGLAGGRIPFGGRVLDTGQMNRILSINADTRTALVQPGVILRRFQDEVERFNLFYPPDPTERDSFIGGTIATNASGARTFKYGPTRHYVESLDIILGSGERLLLRRGECLADKGRLELRTEEGSPLTIHLPTYTMPQTSKHAAGYYVRPDMDAIDLFVGSEGTLGVVVEAGLRLLPLPEDLFSGVVFFYDEEATLAFVEEARTRSRRTRGASGTDRQDIDARGLEYIDANALNLIRDQYPDIPEGAKGGAVWFEQETTAGAEEQLLEAWHELISRHGAMIGRSWFAVGRKDQERMREFRHAVPSAVYEYITRHRQTKFGTDMAVPDKALRELLGYYRRTFNETSLGNVTYGHIGNSHLHANILVSGPDQLDSARQVYHSFITKALALGGTVSAEHGIGKMKVDYLVEMYGAEGVEQMRHVKRTLDPVGILGRGTMFRAAG